jgi:GGDEF domain-containing protein
VKVKDLDARLGGGENAVVLKGTGHFALQAASAFFRVDVQHLLHGELSLGVAAIERTALL